MIRRPPRSTLFPTRRSSDARRRVAGGGAQAPDHALDLVLAPCGEEGGALHRAHPGPDAHRLEVAAQRLGQREEGGERREGSRREAPGVPRLREELVCSWE